MDKLINCVGHDSEGWRWKRHDRLVWSCLFAALAMLAKETGLTALLVNLTFDLYRTWPHIKRYTAQKRHMIESTKLADEARPLSTEVMRTGS